MSSSDRATRRNSEAFRWLRAGVFALVTLGALKGTGFYPFALDALFALTAAVLALFSPGLGVLAFVVPVSLPLMASDLVVGIVFLLIGFAAVQYLGQQDAAAFIVVALAFLAARFGASWAVIALAGYVLGAGEAAVAALIACMVMEVAGLLTGRESVGVLASAGKAPALLDFSSVEEPLKFGWVADSLRGVEPGKLAGALTGVRDPLLMVAQPLLWAAGAALAGSLRREASGPRRPLFGMVAVSAAVVAIALTSTLAMGVFGGPVPANRLVAATAVSLAIALVAVTAWEWLFPPLLAEERQTPSRSGSMSDEDADVDELLRLIASAEEELAAKHTTQAVVMISDMKSFARMTEEEGSVITAKLIQRHRDLLLPVIEAHGGKGKSTGGDGLVACFEDAQGAVSAAVEMQRALDRYNRSRSGEREMTIRIGIAHGEVVLDRGGRPFIGAGLNMAARIMNLADGGQLFVAGDTAGSAGVDLFPSHSHGVFALKNIAGPVEVVEILWREGQTPQGPPFDTAV